MSRGSSGTALRPSGLQGTANGGGAPSIPSSAKKVIQSLKEIVPNSEDEIYAALKECNMDPNETVQRLLSQDPFHEVKRKRDKKKEAASSSVEGRGRGSNFSGRGGRGSGPSDRGFRSNFPSKYPPTDAVGGGRGRPLSSAGNGVLGGRGAVDAPTTAGILGSPAIQPRTGPVSSSQPAYGSHPGGGYTLGSAMSSSGQTSQSSDHSSTTSGTAVYPRPTWGSGATMADIVKASVALAPAPPSDVKIPPLPSSLPSAESSQFVPPSSVGLYASSSDPVLHPNPGPRTPGPQTNAKRDVGIVGNQRPIGERPASTTVPHHDSDSLSSHQLLSVTHPMSSSAISSVSTEPNVDVNTSRALFSSETSSENAAADLPENSASRNELEGSVEGSSLNNRSQSVIGPVQRNIPHSSDDLLPYSQTASQGLDWKSGINQATSSESTELDDSQETSEKETSTEAGLNASSSKLRNLSLQEESPVIIPGHLQVPEADRTRLSFGSFGAGFGSSFGSGFGSDESREIEPSTAENDASESTVNPPNQINAISPPESQSYIQQSSIGSLPTASETLSPSTSLEESKPEPIHLVQQSQTQSQLNASQPQQQGEPTPSQSQQSQPISQPQSQSLSTQNQQVSIQPSQQQQQPSSQQQPQQQQTQQQQPQQQQGPQQHQPTSYPYIPTLQNYPTFGLLTQIPGSQFNTYDGSDSQNSDASRLSGMGLNMPYGDPASYYSPLLRPTPDTESRYTPFSANPTQKYPMGAGTAGMIQGLSASQDVNVSGIGSGTSNLSSQANLAQSNPSITQQPLPIHATYATQPPGIPLGAHYSTLGYAGYTPYLHPSYYMQSPYSHANYPPANTGYGQAPAASSYPPSAAGNFPSTATPSLKFPMPQFKGSTAGSATPLSGVYAAYANPSSYNAIPSVSPANSAGYDDVGGQYKDGNIFIPNQMSRDLSGVQNSSYYNLSQQQPQQQHSAYSHNSQQAANLQTPFANSLYHPSPSGPSTQTHQMMQQPIANAGGSAQPVGYQQQPRSQQGWNSGF